MFTIEDRPLPPFIPSLRHTFAPSLSKSPTATKSSCAQPTNKRKRDEIADSDTSKAGKSPAEETSPEEDEAFNPYTDALISS
jgi:hypothetical protein